MNIHDEIEELMAGALCDALTPDERKNFEQHLAACPHCRSLYEETQKMNEMLTQFMPEQRPDQSFERRIIEKFHEKVSTRGRSPWGLLVWLLQSRAVQAACALLLLAAMVKAGSLMTGESFPGLGGIGSDAYAKNEKQKSLINGDLGFVSIDDSLSRGKGKEELPSGGAVSGTDFVHGFVGQGMIIRGGNTYAGATVITSGSLVMNGSGSVGEGGGISSLGDGVGKFEGKGGKDLFDSSKLITKSGQKAEPESVRRQLPTDQITNGLRSGSQAISGEAIDALVDGSAVNNNERWAANKDAKTSQARPDEAPPTPVQQPKTNASNVPDNLKLIRNANLEFEVPDFGKAAELIATIAQDDGSYITSQFSTRGANGKLQGAVEVKVPPKSLDEFLLKLRTIGDLKNQKLGSQDVTKEYFDIDSRLRNSRIMEERLLDMLQKNTGKVSDLLQVEKELARVREQIEQMQGQLKYYDALVEYATVTIVLREKDMNQAAAYLLKERATLSLFSKDVEKAYAEAKSDADAAKAQIIESHVERNESGSVSATMHLLLAPDTSVETIAKLKAIGRIQNFESQTERVAKDGTGNSDQARTERDKVELNLTIQRDGESIVQQTVMGILTGQVEEKTAQIKQAAAKEEIEVKNAGFSRAANGVEISSLTLRMPLRKYPAFIEQVKSLGKVKDFTVNRNEDAASENALVEINLRIFSQGNIVEENTGIVATVRHTLGQGFAALMWSIRMIGVSLALIAPWAIALSGVLWLILRRRKRTGVK